jgi:hypothetical protein
MQETRLSRKDLYSRNLLRNDLYKYETYITTRHTGGTYIAEIWPNTVEMKDEL